MEGEINMKKIEDMTEEEAAREWEEGEKVDLGPVPERRMSLFTIRIDRNTLDGLVEIGKKEGSGPTVVARGILQEGIQDRIGLPFEVEARRALESAKRTVDSILAKGYTPTASNTMNNVYSYFSPTPDHQFTSEFKRKEEEVK